MKNVMSHIIYLELPSVFGRSKNEIFFICNWSDIDEAKTMGGIFLSQEQWKILLSKQLHNQFRTILWVVISCQGSVVMREIMQDKFWWGSKEGRRKTHQMSWNRLSKTKNIGGMSFNGRENLFSLISTFFK